MYPEVAITGILECFPQNSRRTVENGAPVTYVVVTPAENSHDRIPLHFLREKQYDTARNQYDRDAQQVLLNDLPGSFCLYMTDPATAYGDCRPGDQVTVTAKVYPVKEAYQSQKDKRKTGVSNISQIYFEIVGSIQKAKNSK